MGEIRCGLPCKLHGKPCIIARCEWKKQSSLPIRDDRDPHEHICIECLKLKCPDKFKPRSEVEKLELKPMPEINDGVDEPDRDDEP